MSIKKQNIDKHENVSVVEFGTGDISINSTHEQDSEQINSIYLSSHIEKKQEKWEDPTYASVRF